MKQLTRCLEKIQTVCATMPDPRRGHNTQYTMPDIGLAALSVFVTQSPSFVAHQRGLDKGRGRSHAHTLFGRQKIPGDNPIRQLLDGGSPAPFDARFRDLVDYIDPSGGLTEMRRLDGRTLITLEGTDYFKSYKVHCQNGSTRQRANGQIQYTHQVLAATVVAPGQPQVIPLAPEFIHPQDGHKKQDGEREAAKRWLARLGPHYGDLKPLYLGDDLFACQPIVNAILAAGGNFGLTCKPDSHKTLYEYLYQPPTQSVTRGTGTRQRVVTYHGVQGVPLCDGNKAPQVNWLDLQITTPDGEITFYNAWVTDLEVNRDNIAELVACARARWKIENETFNVLKNKPGAQLEHHFGQGKETLSRVLRVMNLLGFALHGLCDLIEPRWQRARQLAGPRYPFFQDLHFLLKTQVAPSWNVLMNRLIRANWPQPP